MKTLYFDCFAGASGNMILGGLISLGVDPAKLVGQLRLLSISGFEIETTNVNRSGIAAIHTNVDVPLENTHRHLHQIEKIISDSALSETVKRNAIKIFSRLAEAEAKVHGIEVEKVHFHEVGAMDAIIDVVGACICFEILGIEKFAASKIHVGSGFVTMAHGKYPVPPPAVAALLTGIPIYSGEIEGELCTPTGAAIISTLADSFGKIEDFSCEKIGYGAGSRDYPNFPNVIRLMIGETGNVQPKTQNLCLIETNIDDVSSQILGYVMERVFNEGALDCWFTPIQMKKNRPATMISVLCEPEKKPILTDFLYRETTTLGMRVSHVTRECLERKFVKVTTQFGVIDVKIGILNGELVNAMPEYEQLKSVALAQGVSLKLLKEEVLIRLNEQY